MTKLTAGLGAAGLLVAAAMLFPDPVPQARAQSGCIEAGRDGVAIAGRLEASGKGKSGAILLRSQTGICLTGPDEDDKVAPTWVLHAFGANDTVHRQLAGLLGRQVEVRGRLMPALTVHHKAPIVVEVASVTAKP